MINVLFAADFPIAKSGIASTASSILAEDLLGPTALFSENSLLINDKPARAAGDLGDGFVDLIFTHTEYSGLPALQHRYPEAIFHVGDWPLRHWSSVRRAQPVKGTLATLRCLMRLGRIDRSTRLAYVTEEDTAAAIAHGFSRAFHLPIGVKPPRESLANQVDFQSICFSGNFRYQPNRDAAQRLLRLAEAHFPDLRVILVGFYADDFKDQVGNNAEIYADVPSVVDFLAVRRPIYVSLIDTGAGAKNKILEAMVAGCPIICTPESLDSSISPAPSIKIVSRHEEVVSQLGKWNLSSSHQVLTSESSKIADDTRASRSWRSVARVVRDQISARSL
jgi:hypothetical protein